jgi:hypothetical protein
MEGKRAAVAGCRGGRGVMWAGVLVILIGLAVAASRTLEIPRYWVPVVVGVALVSLGAARRALRRR